MDTLLLNKWPLDLLLKFFDPSFHSIQQNKNCSMNFNKGMLQDAFVCHIKLFIAWGLYVAKCTL